MRVTDGTLTLACSTQVYLVWCITVGFCVGVGRLMLKGIVGKVCPVLHFG